MVRSLTLAALLSFVAYGRVVPLRVEQGAAEIECISPSTFRLARTWGRELPRVPGISHEEVKVSVEEHPNRVVIRTSQIVIEVDVPEVRIRVQNSRGRALLAEASDREGKVVSIDFSMQPEERFFGLGADGGPSLRGQRLRATIPFVFSSNGYARFFRAPARPLFDLSRGRIEIGESEGFEYVFHYGPSFKEALEEHMPVVGQGDALPSTVLDVLKTETIPRGATPIPLQPLSSWSAFSALVHRLNQWSFSAVLYPVFDLSSMRDSPPELRQRAMDLAVLLPLLANGRLDRAAREQRERWKPYMITYLREAYDRGYPMIRPILMEFSRDQDVWQRQDVFMLGDELLLAPVLASATKRSVDLPMGRWTDWRTNIEYEGRRRIEIEAPAGTVPMLIKRGSVIPFAAARLEIHYFPPLGGEWFQWEPEVHQNSQYHASPAGDDVRMEIESKVDRVYEWVVHHTKAPREVVENDAQFTKIAAPDLLKPGTWWHDATRNNLHIVLDAKRGSDRIVWAKF
jgi:alpha-glucosidase (family GH31 glycosyl hydrolase)